MLYEDQAYCLGIAYNEERRELYWTAAKSIMAGPSVSSSPSDGSNNNREAKTLFNLDLAKKVNNFFLLLLVSNKIKLTKNFLY